MSLGLIWTSRLIEVNPSNHTVVAHAETEFRNWVCPRQSSLKIDDALKILATQIACHYLEGLANLAIIPFKILRTRQGLSLSGSTPEELYDPPAARTALVPGYSPVDSKVKEVLKAAYIGMQKDPNFGSAVAISPDRENSGRHYAYVYLNRPPSQILGLAIEFHGSIEELSRFKANLARMLGGAVDADINRPTFGECKNITSREIVVAMQNAMTPATQEREARFLEAIRQYPEQLDSLLDELNNRCARVYVDIVTKYNATPESKRGEFLREYAKRGPEIARELFAGEVL